MMLHRAGLGWGFWLLWVLASTVGFAVVGVFFHFPGSFPPQPGGVAAGLVGAVFGAAHGAVVGAMQWLVLRQWVARAGRWMLGTALGIAFVHGLSDGLPDLTVLVPFWGLSGAVVGILQWLSLQRILSPLPWVLANIAAWTLGFALGIALAPLDWAERKEVVGAVVGVVAGAVTGLLMVWQARRGVADTAVTAQGSGAAAPSPTTVSPTRPLPRWAVPLTVAVAVVLLAFIILASFGLGPSP